VSGHTPWREIKHKRQETILEEAARIVSGDRNDQYGDPQDDLGYIGRKWAATLEAHTGVAFSDIPAHIVALMMIDLKTSRLAFKMKRDSLVDVVGYALCAEASVPPQEAS
jgi:hypothetical protein